MVEECGSFIYYRGPFVRLRPRGMRDRDIQKVKKPQPMDTMHTVQVQESAVQVHTRSKWEMKWRNMSDGDGRSVGVKGGLVNR